MDETSSGAKALTGGDEAMRGADYLKVPSAGVDTVVWHVRANGTAPAHQAKVSGTNDEGCSSNSLQHLAGSRNAE